MTIFEETGVTEAFDWLNPLDSRTEAGACRLCGQPSITRRHNCDDLRRLAAPIRAAKIAAQAACEHANTYWGKTYDDHEADRYVGGLNETLVCRDCGANLRTTAREVMAGDE